ncbi:hypothetical protein SDC9_152759 [bioreactor metagenome]|uniref:Uncharacterized protein n=1 Tax=bioreactor metagenome TaxID=1076179 RepID=A0A645ETZ0_9ZZZZ
MARFDGLQFFVAHAVAQAIGTPMQRECPAVEQSFKARRIDCFMLLSFSSQRTRNGSPRPVRGKRAGPVGTHAAQHAVFAGAGWADHVYKTSAHGWNLICSMSLKSAPSVGSANTETLSITQTGSW